jgi:putative hydrolase of the HAD superfamily
MTRAVLFDFAGTLWSDRALRDTHLRTLEQVATRAGVGGDARTLRRAYRDGLISAASAYVGQTYYFHRDIFRESFRCYVGLLGGEADDALCTWAVDTQYDATLADFRLRDDCLETLAALRARGLHVGLVSNIDDDQLLPMMGASGLEDVLDAWTSSEEAGSCKPDARIFPVALERAGCSADEALFVGDTPSADVAGARGVGMGSVRLSAAYDDPAALPEADHVATSHAALRRMLGVGDGTR